MANGRMAGGFALVVWPASHIVSYSDIRGQSGRRGVPEKDGERDDALVTDMTRFDPVGTLARVDMTSD
jgi:hypothetical protein